MADLPDRIVAWPEKQLMWDAHNAEFGLPEGCAVYVRESSAAITAYMPVQPSGEWWVAGCGASPQEAFGSVLAREGCIPWAECEAMGWKVVAVKITLI